MTDALRRLWAASFDDPPEAIDAFFTTAYSPQRCRSLTVEGGLAAALHWLDAEFQGQKLAYVYAVATAPAYRGRGLCRKLMEQTHAHLAQSGYAAALLSPAGEGLRRMYAAMGYRDCCFRREQICGWGEPTALRPVDAEEFARLRRQFLPEDGVIQEGAHLAYLSTYAKFYAGTDFLLAAARQGDTLLGLELLGSPSAGAGIVGALGCARGRFRMPGRDIPVGMILPLVPDAPIPGYLGFPLD